MHTAKPYQPCHSSPISSKGANNLLFAVCHKAEEENKAKTRVFSKENSDVEHSFSKEDSDVDDLSSKNEDHWENKANRGVQTFWINITNTPKAKKNILESLSVILLYLNNPKIFVEF